MRNTRALALDGSDLYALSSDGGIVRYSRGGGSPEPLLVPDGIWHSNVNLALDERNVYELAIDTDADLLFPTTTVSYRVVAKDTGAVTVIDPSREVISRITGDGEHGYGLRWRHGDTLTNDIVELAVDGGKSIMPMPDDGFGVQLVGGSLFVLAYNGLWRVDAGTVSLVFDDVPSAIVSHGTELIGVVGGAGDDVCRVIALESRRCIYAGDVGDIAVANDALYFTYRDGDEWVLDRVVL